MLRETSDLHRGRGHRSRLEFAASYASASPRSGRSSLILFAAVLFITVLFAAASMPRTAHAQATKPAPKKAEKPDEKEKKDEPKFVTLTTKDGVELVCTYYPSPKAEKEGKRTIPIMLVHDWGESGAVFTGLARSLQQLGNAVIVPDLRGHGRSTRLKNDSGEIVQSKMKPADVAAMVADLVAVKAFLMEENNAGNLNIEMLSIVGSGVGGLVAMTFTAHDWSLRDLPAFKRGKDVKALVLLSPPATFKGLSAKEIFQIKALHQYVSVQIVAGAEEKELFADAKRLHNKFEQARPKLRTGDNVEQKQSVFLEEISTSLKATQLLDNNLGVGRKIVEFLSRRVYKFADRWKWSERVTE